MEIFKRNKFLSLIVVYVLISLMLALGAFIYNGLKNPYGDRLEITNLDSYTSGKPTNKDRVDYIKHSLYTTVKLNVGKKVEINSIKDIAIRDRSFSQTYDKSTNVYTVHFIVDTKSLKQSYRVSYQWSDKDKYSTHVNEYGTQVTCLPLSELLYGDFKCEDERIREQGVENYDPVGQILPYHVEAKYQVVDYKKVDSRGDKRVFLYVDAYAPRWALRPSDTTIEKYTFEIKKWLTTNKLDSSKYVINFRY